MRTPETNYYEKLRVTPLTEKVEGISRSCPRYHRLSVSTIVCGLFLQFLSLVIVPQASAEQTRITVVRVAKDKSSDRLIRGIKAQLKQDGADTNIETVETSGIPKARQTLPDSLRHLNPDVIITIGSGVTHLVNDSITDIPIVFAGVFYPELSGFVESRSKPGGNITGSSLDIDPDVQFKYFKQVYPNLRKLGILYSAETAKLIPHAKVVAQAQGIELVAVEVGQAGSSHERDIYRGLDSLLSKVDGLWSLADPRVFSKAGTRMIIKQTLLKKAPFMGFSATIVSSGALFALDIDYKDVGRQTGEIVSRIIRGDRVSEIPITAPRMIWFHYNEKTALRVSTSIPEELRVIAKEVHQ